MLSLVHQFFRFLRHEKKLWMLPIILILLALGGILVVAQSSAFAPFIYAIF